MNKYKIFLMPAVLLLTVVMGTTFGDEISPPSKGNPTGDAQGAVSNSASAKDLAGRLGRIKLFLKTMQVAEDLMGDHLFQNQGTMGNYYRAKLYEITTRSHDPQKTGTADSIAIIENDLERFEKDLIIDTANVFPGVPSSGQYLYSASNNAEYYKKKNEEIKNEINNMLAEWKQNAVELKKKGTDIDLSIETERVQVGMDKAFEAKFPDRLYMQRYGFYRAIVSERFHAAGLTPVK